MVSAAITGTTKAASNDAGFSAGSVKSDKSDKVGSFSSIMAKSLGSNAAASNSASKKASVVNIKQNDAVSANKQEASKSSTGDGVDSTGRNSAVKDTDSADKAVKTDKADGTDSAGNAEVDEGFEAEAVEAAESVLDKIKKALGISDEELEKCMEELGLNMLDMLDANNVIKLVMEATGTQDAMQLVTDGELSAALKDIMDYVSQVTDELSAKFDLSSKELKAMLGQISDNGDLTNAGVETAAVQTADEGFERVAETEPKAETSESVEDVVASKITVERENEAAASNSDSGKEQLQGKAQNSDNVNVNAGQGNVVQQLSQTFETVFTAGTQEVNAADVVRQVVDAIKLTNTRAMQSMEIQLNPENLGKVNILVSVREGVVTAQIATQNEQVKRALEGQLSTLKENFENQGIKVEAVEVTVQSNAFDGNAQFGDRQQQETSSKARRHINLNNLSFDDDEPEEEQSIIANANSSVEYTA